jgi:hypothetical protein
MNEQRNDPGKRLLEPWERSQGVQMGGAKEMDGVLEFRNEPEWNESGGMVE